MFGQTRTNPFDDIFNFQREADRLFNQFWNDLPTHSASAASAPFNVQTSEDGWRLDIPLPGVDPQYVTLEVAGSTLHIRADQPGDKHDREVRFEQSLTVPKFLDLDKITASHRHGMLQLTLPLKESVRPRRVPIEGITDDKKQLTTV